MNEDRIFGAEIIELAVVAPGLHEGWRGWTAESACRALESLRSTKVGVVAIDVFDRVVWGFAPSGESWACLRKAGEFSLEFASRSREEAREWIAGFPRNDVLFAIEFSTQDLAAEGRGRSDGR